MMLGVSVPSWDYQYEGVTMHVECEYCKLRYLYRVNFCERLCDLHVPLALFLYRLWRLWQTKAC